MTSSIGSHIPRFGELQRERLTKLLRTFGSTNEFESAAARAAIDRLLKGHGKAWSDLVELLGGSPAGIHPDLIRDLTALGSDDHVGARAGIQELLDRHRKTWNDFIDQLCTLAPAGWVSHASWKDPEPVADLLALLVGTLKEYVELTPAEYIAVSLWILHTHCFRSFMVTPRLALRSPTPGCGKTVLIDLMVRLTARGKKYDAITTAALYHLIDETQPTLLIDEADNLGIALQANGKLRSVLNAGHRHGGTVGIQERYRTRDFSVFAPLALALALPDTIGGLTRTLDSRCIVTTGRLVLRLMDPTAGSVRFKGEEIATLDKGALRRLRRHMQIIFQDPYASLNPRMTVGEILAEPLQVHEIGDATSREAGGRELLEIVGLLPEHARRYPVRSKN
jgi:hypothetical protein